MPKYPKGQCQCGCGDPAPIAQRTDPRHGWVRGEPLKYILGHSRRNTGPEYVVDGVTGCWIWKHAISKKGYGTKTIKGKTLLAHRVVYERHRGPIPEGGHIDHLCRTPGCVNPDHLEVVTNAENIRRGLNAKLSWEKVRAIRADPRGLSQRALAAEYGVTHTAIYEVLANRTWREEDDPMN